MNNQKRVLKSDFKLALSNILSARFKVLSCNYDNVFYNTSPAMRRYIIEMDAFIGRSVDSVISSVGELPTSDLHLVDPYNTEIRGEVFGHSTSIR
jgi:hypothetical protein